MNKCACGCGGECEKRYIWGHCRRGANISEETRQKTSKALTGLKKSDKTRERMSAAKMGNQSSLGHKQTKLHKRKIGRALKGQPKSEKHKRKLREALLGRVMPKVIKTKISKTMTDDKHIRLRIAAQQASPNKFEKRIIGIIKKYNFEFKFVGDGRKRVGTKIPDFIHKSKPILVECYTEYYKGSTKEKVEQWKTDRRAYFNRRGYKTIFIHYDDSEPTVVRKLSRVM